MAEIEREARTPDWDPYFLGLAEAVSFKSKDTSAKVGAVIVAPDLVVVATGYNGFPRGVDDAPALLNDQREKLERVCHAELNAIVNATRSSTALKRCTIYVNKFPCYECCKAIVQAGITRIVTHASKYWIPDELQKRPGEQRKYEGRIRDLLRQVHPQLGVTAPFHPDFRSTKIGTVRHDKVTLKKLLKAEEQNRRDAEKAKERENGVARTKQKAKPRLRSVASPRRRRR